MEMENCLIFEDWLEFTRPYHLRIKDVLAMKSGMSAEFLCLDRNVEEIFEQANKKGAIKKPSEFFEENYFFKFVNREALKGKGFITFEGCEEREYEEFEFQIEYKPNCWYPLENGNLKGDKYCNIPQELIGSWEKFPDDTRIGWRGPMINIKHLENMPKVFWK